MGGKHAGAPEIRGRLHNAAAEMMLPHAVDQHTRSQRVLGAGDPLRKGEPAAAGIGVCPTHFWRKLFSSQDAEEGRLDFRSWRERIAANEHMGGFWLRSRFSYCQSPVPR